MKTETTLTPEEIEEIRSKAQRSLKNYFQCPINEVPLPIDPDAIVQYELGFRVEYADLSNNQLGNVEGVTEPRTKTVWIEIKIAKSCPLRALFTVAHEAGHIVLHVDRWIEHIHEQLMLCEPEKHEPELLFRITQKHNKKEDEADCFAAELLMPDVIVKRLLEDYLSVFGETKDKQFLIKRAVSRLCKQFEVSRATMRKRIYELGLWPRFYQSRLNL